MQAIFVSNDIDDKENDMDNVTDNNNSNNNWLEQRKGTKKLRDFAKRAK